MFLNLNYFIHSSNFIYTGNKNTKTDAEITHSIPTVSNAKRLILTTDNDTIMGNSHIIASCINAILSCIEINLPSNNLSFILDAVDDSNYSFNTTCCEAKGVPESCMKNCMDKKQIKNSEEGENILVCENYFEIIKSCLFRNKGR